VKKSNFSFVPIALDHRNEVFWGNGGKRISGASTKKYDAFDENEK